MLVFSQFVQMLLLLEEECRQHQIPTHMLTGQTKDRQQVVSTFQSDPNAAVFLLSLRAAGTGVFLEIADDLLPVLGLAGEHVRGDVAGATFLFEDVQHLHELREDENLLSLRHQ